MEEVSTSEQVSYTMENRTKMLNHFVFIIIQNTNMII